MNLPRLTEVFIIREASVGNISRILGVSATFQDHIDKFFQKKFPSDKRFAFVLVKFFLLSLKAGDFGQEGEKVASWLKDKNDPVNGTQIAQNAMELFEIWMQDFGSHRGQGILMLHSLKHNPSLEKKFMTLNSSAEVMSLLADMNKKDLSEQAVMKFEDGFYWVELKGDECDYEGGKMQHCGMAEGNMYSLRDSHGNPHVTLDVLKSDRDQPHKAIQIRGKQNAAPDRKYFKYIRDFFVKFGIEPDDDELAKNDNLALAGLMKAVMGAQARGEHFAKLP